MSGKGSEANANRRITAVSGQLLSAQVVAGGAASAVKNLELHAGSAAVPLGFEVVPGDQDPEVAAHLKWLAQKDQLGQDSLLLGPPGALRRHLVLRYCELWGREAEVLTVTRDTTEADLKQRREIHRTVAGAKTVYYDGAPVRCAMHGRILILDGLEKAERNVLPTLNNLLENREMALDDGRLLVPAARYDSLVEDLEEARSIRLVRVHDNFRVVALALPSPPWPGNPLDPPLRSRFQARVVVPPMILSSFQLAPIFGSENEEHVSDGLLRRLAALQRALNAQALGGSDKDAASSALAAALPAGSRPPVLTHDALLRVLRLLAGSPDVRVGCRRLPVAARPGVEEALRRAYPLEFLAPHSSSPAATPSPTADRGVVKGPPEGSNALREATLQLVRHFWLADGEHAASTPSSSIDGVKCVGVRRSEVATEVVLEFGEAGAQVSLPSPGLPQLPSEFFETQRLRHLITAIVQDFAVGHDCLLVGPPGCGKSALARHLAALLGHGAPGGVGLEYFFLHEEMSSRDLFQRRGTDAAGATIWTDSPLVRACRSGALCVLDGAHRLRGDMLCALAPLLQDRQVSLAVAGSGQGVAWELLLRSDRYKLLRRNALSSFDEKVGCLVGAMHPAFRVMALGEPPTQRHPWLSDELSACFSSHRYPDPGPGDTVQLLGALVPGLPRDIAEKMVCALAPAAASSDASGSTAVKSKAKDNPCPASSAPIAVPLRVLLRVARRAAAASTAGTSPSTPSAMSNEAVSVEIVAGVLQQHLFPFLPKGEKRELLTRLTPHFGSRVVELAVAHTLRRGVTEADSRSPLIPAEVEAVKANSKMGASLAGPVPTVQLGKFAAPRGNPRHPELVPSVYFVGIDRHVALLEDLARALFQRDERYLLILGPQGVGKNRVVDHFLQTLALEREYMQLHRDTTVAQLTVTPVVTDGRLLHEDSPLVRAAVHGRVLVLDEADKAPLEVVVVLKSLIEDGQLALPDGRRLAKMAAKQGVSQAPTSVTLVPVHPDFRMIVLANRPGFPFLGNDLMREADVFSIFCLDNPDATSELQLASAAGPKVPQRILKTLVALFADLRLALEEGRLQYPYSARELLAVVRHLNRFPDEPLDEALSSVLAFDRFDVSLRETLRPILERRGVPSDRLLGPAVDASSVGGTANSEPWVRALAALRETRLAAVYRLGPPAPAGAWSVATLPVTHEVQDVSCLVQPVETRPASLDPPRFVSLADLQFDRSAAAFNEGVLRARLPLARYTQPVIDAAMATAPGPMLHILSLNPLAIWTIEDPLSLGADAGRCSVFPIGPGSGWAFGNLFSRHSVPEDASSVLVNGRDVVLGSPQLAWIGGSGSLLVHNPFDFMGPQLLIERPHREDVQVEVLHIQALLSPKSTSGAGQVRSPPEESFVVVPLVSQNSVPHASSEYLFEDPRKGDTKFLFSSLIEAVSTENASPDIMSLEYFDAKNSLVFFQPSSRRVVQLDAVHRVSREVKLETLLSPKTVSKSSFLRNPNARLSITASPTPRGVEVLISSLAEVDASSALFLALNLPSLPSPTRAAAETAAASAKVASARHKPTARWISSTAAQREVARSVHAMLPALASQGLVSSPFGSDCSPLLSALESTSARHLKDPALETAPSTAVAHLLDSHRGADHSWGAWALFVEADIDKSDDTLIVSQPSLRVEASVAEMVAASDAGLNAWLASQRADQMPLPRNQWTTCDVVSGSSKMLVRVLRSSGSKSGDWLEAVDLPSGSVRRLPAWPVPEAAQLSTPPKTIPTPTPPKVSRLLTWPAPSYVEGRSDGSSQPWCVTTFQDGSVRWLELCPTSLEQSLRDHLEVRGLRGLLESPEESDDDRLGMVEPSEKSDDISFEEEPSDDAHQSEHEVDALSRVSRAGQRKQSNTRGPRGMAARAKAYKSNMRVQTQTLSGSTGPERLREWLLRQAQQQRRNQLKQQQERARRSKRSLLTKGREEQMKDGKLREVTAPKHGKEDNEEHIGGNTFAGGSGGADTAGLGGRGGPYRLEKKGQRVHQVSDEAKAQVSAEAREAARRMGEEALKRRLEEIELGGGDYKFYISLLSEIQGEADRLRAVLGNAAARQQERHWKRGLEGELDENRLVDALAGESSVFRRRIEREKRPGEPLALPKKALFLFDASASMYRFNGTDGRLRRSCETAVMIMEALRGLEARFDYALAYHDGDNALQEVIPFGQPPVDEKARLAVVSRMIAASQHCSSGDNTLPAIQMARQKVASVGPADDRFVFVFSDANFARYGLTADNLGAALSGKGTVYTGLDSSGVIGRDSGSPSEEVRSVLFLIATFEDEALEMARRLPDQVRVCLDPRMLPQELRQEFASRVTSRRFSAL